MVVFRSQDSAMLDSFSDLPLASFFLNFGILRTSRSKNQNVCDLSNRAFIKLIVIFRSGEIF